MVGVFIKSAKALSVHNQHIDRFSLRRETLNRFAPDPNSLFSKESRLTCD